jgi:hypothetical protein
MAQVSQAQRVLYTLTNWALFAAGLINLAIGTRSAVHQEVAIAVTSLTAGLVLLFAATIDRFESLKGLGVEAKTRQLDRKLEQADEALEKLKELAELTGANLIDLGTRMGRFDTAPTLSESYALAQRVRAILNGVGSDASRVRATLRPFVLTMLRDITFALTRPLVQPLMAEEQRLQNQRMAIPQPWNSADPNVAQLTASITAVQKYRDEKLSKFPDDPDEYPEALLSRFDDVPLPDQSIVQAARTRAMEFVPGMRSLKEDFTVSDPERWSQEREKAWKPT